MARRWPVISEKLVVADVIVYGATPAGIVAAISAAEQGASVALIGGWRENHTGGMLSSGLAWTDYRSRIAFGGHSAAIIRRLAGPHGAPGNELAFDPHKAEPLFDALLRQHGVPVIWTAGVEEVGMRSRRITALRTVDGQRASGRIFIDASYEGDLLARAGVSYHVGREAANADNTLDGYRGAMLDDPRHHFGIGGRALQVSPFVSGGQELLPGIVRAPTLPVGAADKGIQAYCFRMTMTTDPGRRVDLPSTPPAGYRAADYELLFRLIDTASRQGLVHGRDWTFRKELIKADEVAPGIFDVNNHGSFSTDAIGMSWSYPEASYADRETSWKAHENHIRGFFYALGHAPDPRVPESLRREVRDWGLVRGYYERPREGDAAHWPYQLYVREARRLDNGLQWSGADLTASDRTVPRVGNIVAMASYMQDSHAVQRIAVPVASGGWRTVNEGQLSTETGGSDRRAPLPFDLMLPHRSQAVNLIVPFCVASTHQAFAAIRMELSAMALGEAAGCAAALAISDPHFEEIQKLPYQPLADLLRANGAVLDEETLAHALWRKHKPGMFQKSS